MMTNDPIADLLTRIRNAKERQKNTVEVPHTKMVEALSSILKEEGFVNGYTVEKDKVQGKVIIELKYVNGTSAITELKRISKPGLRIYSGYRQIPRIKNGLGITIVSTSRGLMSDEKARAEKLGGEVLATIW